MDSQSLMKKTVDNVLVLYNMITIKSPSYWVDIKYDANDENNTVSITWDYNGLCLDVFPTGYQLHNHKGFEVNYTLEEASLTELVNDLITLKEL